MIPAGERIMNDDDYAKLHSRSYTESPVLPMNVRRQTTCRCETRGDRPVEIERIREGVREIVRATCTLCGRAVPGIPR